MFYTDKQNSVKGRSRIPEKTLHLLELGGGVFFNWLLMYLIRHKNKKKSYYIPVYLILILWLAIMYFVLKIYL